MRTEHTTRRGRVDFSQAARPLNALVLCLGQGIILSSNTEKLAASKVATFVKRAQERQ